MIVALLILIAFILLFGAGVVKGWFANIVSYGCGLLIVITLIVWVGSFIGPDGPIYLFMGAMALLFISAILMKLSEPSTRPSVVNSSESETHILSRLKPVDAAAGVWTRFAPVLEGNISEEDSERIKKLISSNDHLQLIWRCKNHVREIYGADAQKILARCGFR